MAHQVIWTAEATRELDDAAAWIADHSDLYASAFVRRVLTTATSLSLFPLQGHVVEELGHPDVREVPVRGYRLVYQVRRQSVEIISLTHGARELPDLSSRLRTK